MFASRNNPGRFLQVVGTLVTTFVTLLASTSTADAQAQPVPTVADRIDLVALTTRQPQPDAPSNLVQFQTTVNYRFQSAESGFVLLFLFENSASDSSQQSSDAVVVQRGTGQLVLNIDYALRPDVRTLTLVAALFKGEQQLVAWVSTNPIDMAPWPGRVAFEKAMAARLNQNFGAAELELSTAILDAPETFNYYYWRGDTRIRLNDLLGALSDFDRSVELMPQDRPSRVGRGIARLWLGQAQLAVEDLSVAIDSVSKADRVSAWAYRARGLARASLGQSADAVADYQAYLALTPDAADRAQVEGWIADLS
jgi:tetratricopeptide (TPR) repeat protein